MVFGDWWTNETGDTSSSGEFATRGFKGDYLVTVTVGDFSETLPLSLLTAETMEFTVPLVGDYNKSGEIDGGDVDLMFAAYGPAEDSPEYDLDGSGTIDFSDVEQFVAQFGQTKIGDMNFDGTVDVLNDAATLIVNLGNTGVGYAAGDLDGDGLVTVLGDASMLIINLGQ